MSAAFLTIPSAERLQVLAASEQTGGAFGLVAATLTPGETPPPHIHHGEDETYYVLDGHLRIRVGAEQLDLGTGALVFAPRGVPHHLVVVSPSAD
jgi:mannose-6-phosphate isomerase-like protein (cupin superfamily)